MNRRNFIKKPIVAGTAGCMPNLAFGNLPNQKTKPETDLIWGCLLHLSFNFAGRIDLWGGIRTKFETDEAVWDRALNEMARQGLNLVLINTNSI